MDIVGLIVEAEGPYVTALAETLGKRPHIILHSIRNNSIVLELDTDDIHVIAENIKEIGGMKGAKSVLPIFSRELITG